MDAEVIFMKRACSIINRLFKSVEITYESWPAIIICFQSGWLVSSFANILLTQQLPLTHSTPNKYNKYNKDQKDNKDKEEEEEEGE